MNIINTIEKIIVLLTIILGELKIMTWVERE